MSGLLRRLGIGASEIHSCPECGAQEVRATEKLHSFPYMRDGAVKLKVREPVWVCGSCEYAYTDGRCEALEQEVIDRFLRRRLLPREIRSIRTRSGWSRATLARLTGYGEKSIKRWETGELVQNASADRFLRLIDNEMIATALVQLKHQIDAAKK